MEKNEGEACVRACVFVLGDEGAKPEMEWWRSCFQESGSIQDNFVLQDGRGFDCYIISQLSRCLSFATRASQ